MATMNGNIVNLPAWAREYIQSVRRERDIAVRALHEYCDQQSPSPFRVEHYECIGEQGGPVKKIQYVQAPHLTVEYEDVRLDVYVREHEGITLQYGTPDCMTDHVALVPQSFQRIALIAKHRLRGGAGGADGAEVERR